MIERERKTPMGQRIAIFCIAGLMVVSTIALYISIVISDGNARREAVAAEEAMERFEEKMGIHDAAMEQQRLELSARYFEKFNGFRSEVRAFNAEAVTELRTRDLVVGEGREIGEGDFNYAAFYIGFLPDETIFDSSLNEASLQNPLPGSPNMIEGWAQGLVGMRIGGVREITIPWELGYGAQGAGDTIPGMTPLRFIVMLIEPPAEILFPAGTIDACTIAYWHQFGEIFGSEEATREFCESMIREE